MDGKAATGTKPRPSFPRRVKRKLRREAKKVKHRLELRKEARIAKKEQEARERRKEARMAQHITKVGILSDTHGRLPLMAAAEMAECDAIIHAGDICSHSILTELECLAPTYAVLGNNDRDEYGSRVGYFAHPEIAGVRFLVGHKPSSVAISPLGNGALAPGDPIPQVIVHGHTHVPLIQFGPDVRPADLLINPGSTTKPRRGAAPSVAVLEIAGGAVRNVRIISLNDGTTVLQWPASD